ncbi:DUF6270 domain-containing protein [Heyndrickxia oleronia]|uniref:DUF6270 domain-containing protein n=1 Tax=Heyndrickxia oleronia TaxID=38875 RepID=UPI00203CA88A|nr:DUF6270 domain-containing protein [Heyndrickxia oleronia]MCM3238356.1 DUF6270 domain-containing protein [Heyndrickxia oleronia]
MQKKIAILGSCATRDNFNSKINHEYKKYYQCILTQQHSSIISIMSPPVSSIDISQLDNLREGMESFILNLLKTDLNKKFLIDLTKMQPDYLIIDFFGDIYFGTLFFENGVTTNNRWHLHKTSFYKNLIKKQPLNLIENTSDYLSLWIRSVRDFMEYVETYVPNCKIIIHKARFINRYIDENGSERTLEGINYQYFNHLWNILDNYVITKFKCEFIDLASEEEYLITQLHPLWDLWYLHYEKKYYQDFLKSLNNIVYKR